jgi:hypothetical protein
MIEEARDIALRRGAWKFTPSSKGLGEPYNLDADIGE